MPRVIAYTYNSDQHSPEDALLDWREGYLVINNQDRPDDPHQHSSQTQSDAQARRTRCKQRHRQQQPTWRRTDDRLVRCPERKRGSRHRPDLRERRASLKAPHERREEATGAGLRLKELLEKTVRPEIGGKASQSAEPGGWA